MDIRIYNILFSSPVPAGNVHRLLFQQVMAKFQLQNLLLRPDVLGLGLGLVLVAGMTFLLNSLTLLKEAMAFWRAVRASCRWAGRGVCWARCREDSDLGRGYR